jgi:hypothetical protein
MFVIIHNSDDGNGSWSRIVELGKDVVLPPLTCEQFIEPEVFHSLTDAIFYVEEDLGMRRDLCPVVE